MSDFILHDYVLHEIENRVDLEIKKHPEAAADKDIFIKELINYYGNHGNIPDFSLTKNEG